MVKITKEYLIKHSDGLKIKPLRRKDESDNDFLKRITHLKLQGKYIEHLEDLKSCSNVVFLYLQNNILQTIHNLDSFAKLTHLYLQRNKIVKMENLSGLVNLRKLYLGYNEVSVIEGLEDLILLRELHVEYQSLPLGETVYFDPRSVQALSACLQILNISGNGLVSLSPVAHLANLMELIALENKIESVMDLGSVLETWPMLLRIRLDGNAVQSERYFKDTVILSSHSLNFLEFLDEMEILPTSRVFLQGWKKAKSSQSKQSRSESKLPVTKAVHFSQFMKARSTIPTKPLTFQPWKLRKNVNSFDGKLSPGPSKMRPSQLLDETV